VHDYPKIEQQSWTEQNREAQAYLAWIKNQQGEAPITPVLNNILIGRNGHEGSETLRELCEAVVRNAERFTIFQQITGKRQRLVKLVASQRDLDSVLSVKWN